MNKKKTKAKNLDWWYTFNPLSEVSPNGQFTVKEGDVGTPICIVPLPAFGGRKPKIREEELAKKISALPELTQACIAVLTGGYGCAPSVGYMDELKMKCEQALIKAGVREKEKEASDE